MIVARFTAGSPAQARGRAPDPDAHARPQGAAPIRPDHHGDAESAAGLPALDRAAAVVCVRMRAVAASPAAARRDAGRRRAGARRGRPPTPGIEAPVRRRDQQPAGLEGPPPAPGVTASSPAWPGAGPTGWSAPARSPTTRTSAAEVSGAWTKLGENVGVGYDVDGLMQAFVNSPAHYANLVDPDWTHVGVGVTCGADGRMYTTHDFMALGGGAAPPPPPRPRPRRRRSTTRRRPRATTAAAAADDHGPAAAAAAPAGAAPDARRGSTAGASTPLRSLEAG